MPNKKLTDNEIIKALEEYINFADLEYTNHTSIEVDILKNALDLINRQEEEKQNLKAEVERLKNNPALPKSGFINLLCGAFIYTETLEQYNKFRRTFKAEAYKECLKKFEKNIKDVKVTLGQTWEIQNALKKTLNELVGDDNA